MPINYDNYHPYWKDVIRPEALKRAGYRCQVCGVPNHKYIHRELNGDWLDCSDKDKFPILYSGYKIIRIVLTVAHLNHLTWDNSDANLRVLCQLHHLEHDRPHKHAMRRTNLLRPVEEIIAKLDEPDGKYVLPIVFAKLRAMHREVFQLKDIEARTPGRNLQSDYWRLIRNRVVVVEHECTLIEKKVAQILAQEFRVQDPEMFIDNYLKKSLRARA